MLRSRLDWATGELLHSRLRLRLVIASLIFFDALVGLRYHNGSLNLIDWVVLGKLPYDMIWLAQSLQGITACFGFVKIIFDDFPKGPARSIGILLSPLIVLMGAIFTADQLLFGLPDVNYAGEVVSPHSSASFALDLVSIGGDTMHYSSQYLLIAIGLTLTYKVQRYGNFAQAELFMVGMFLGLIVALSDQYYSITSSEFHVFEAPYDGVLTWSVLLSTLLLAFVITGIIGVIIDRLVYRGFRIRDASPQTMMIASLGVALILRSIFYLRFGAASKLYSPDADWKRASGFRDTGLWRLDTLKMRFVLGDRSIEDGSTYRQFNCEETIDEATGEAVLTRIVTEGSKPPIEIYDVTTACAQATTNYPHYKGISVFVIFSTALLLLLLLNKTRLGRRMRAVADNPELAASSGINVERVQMTSAFLSGAICGVGGVMYGITVGNFEPGDAFKLLLPSFAVIVLGTIGSIRGAIVAAIIIGFSRAVSNPILGGVGNSIDRGAWMALSEVVPYVLIIAILMIMPEGIGHAWEKWRIDRLRDKREYNPEESSKTTAALAILPTGALGLHHWHRGRSDKASTFSVATIAAFIFHRFSRFVGRESFSEGACNAVCDFPLREMEEELADLLLIPEPTPVDADRIEELRSSIDQFSMTNLEMLTQRDDGTLLLEDSPFSLEDSPTFSETATAEDEAWLSEVSESWFDLMQAELDLVNLIADLGDLAWPLVPLLIWAFAAFEGAKILRNNDHESSEQPSAFSAYMAMRQSFQKTIQETISPVKQTFTGASESISSTWHRIDNWHSDLISRSRIFSAQEILKESISGAIPESAFPYGRRGRRGSWLAFLFVLAILVSFMAWLPISPSVESFRWSKVLQVSNIAITLSIFILMAFSLNLHTGYTGMVNFGVIFFVGIGAFTVGILTCSERLGGYDWGVFPATVLAILLAAAFGWALAYPTARLRTDYFAIVTISLGEVLRVFATNEPLLWVGSVFKSFGVSAYTLPLKKWWFCGSGVEIGDGSPYASPNDCREASILSPSTPDGWDPTLAHPSSSMSQSVSDLLGLGDPAPYELLLAVFCLLCVALVWSLLEALMASPWGRILKSIREDEEVAQHHGHDVLTHKAASLALGAAIAGLAGAIWAWKLNGFEPGPFMSPAKSTFLVWGAFVIGGVANNRGMVAGASIIIVMDFVLNAFAAASSPDMPLYESAGKINDLLIWLVTEQWEVTKAFLLIAAVGIAVRSRGVFELGLSGASIFAFSHVFFSETTLQFVFDVFGEISFAGAPMNHVKVLLVGSVMLFSLKYNPSGLIPEVPSRPERPNGGVEV